MLGLTIEERGAYNALIDLIDARAPRGGVTDQLVCKALGCRPQVWRRLKVSLMAKDKVWESPPGNVLANRVVSEVVSAEFRTQNMVRLGRVSALKRSELNKLIDGVWQKRDPTAHRWRHPDLRKKQVSPLPRASKAEPKQGATEKKPEELTLAEINAIRYGAKS